MNSTRPRGPVKRSGERGYASAPICRLREVCPTEARAQAASFLLLGIAWLLAGCAAAGTVHPEYERLSPRIVCVAPVANETIHQLDEVSFGGLFQRTVLWPRRHSITAILSAAAEESLLRKGYETRTACAGNSKEPGSPAPDYRKPLPQGSPPPEFDAVLYLTVEEWATDRYAGSSMHLVYRLELFRVPTADLLYFGRFSCGYREDPHEPRTDELPMAIRRSVASAFAALPPARAE